MAEIEQENAQPQEQPEVRQLVMPKEAEKRFAEIEKQYLETIERENITRE